MSFLAAIVVIAGIWAVVSVIRSRHNAALGYATDEEGRPVGNPEREAELRREIEELRERVQVLERIVTDDSESKRLSAEIERLREER